MEWFQINHLTIVHSEEVLPFARPPVLVVKRTLRRDFSGSEPVHSGSLLANEIQVSIGTLDVCLRNVIYDTKTLLIQEIQAIFSGHCACYTI